MNEPTEEALKELAQQLRKPAGPEGSKIADFMSESNHAMNLKAISILNPSADESVLEVGMGNGLFVKNILGAHPEVSYTGLDYSALMVEQSISNNQRYIREGRASFHCGDISKMPFEDDSFDCILTVNTFYFWDSKHQVIIKELERVLKPKGRLVLAIRPYHVLRELPVAQFNFDLREDHEVISLFENNGFELTKQFLLKEPEFENWGATYKLESLFLELTPK